jgi:hypothetical protein
MTRRVREMFESGADVEEIKINPTTGSVKIYYDPDHVDAQQLLNLLKYNDLFDENRVVAQDEYLSSTGHKAGTALGKAALSWTMGRVLEANGLSLLAAFV